MLVRFALDVVRRLWDAWDFVAGRVRRRRREREPAQPQS
jgi:hypothetical protein